MDCGDFLAAVPTAPSLKELHETVRQHHSTSSTHRGLSEAERLQQEHVVDSTVFDLRYRCGAAGRCTCAGAPACRFPRCFALRPLTKGAEVHAEREVYEATDAPSAEIKAIADLAKAEKLEEAVSAIQRLVGAKLITAAGGQQLDTRLVMHGEPGLEFSPSRAATGAASAQAGANPLRADKALREEVLSLYLWRAVLLVNQRRDDKAVHSLLNLADALAREDRVRLYSAAAAWATLNDMEIIAYRSILRQYQPFATAEVFAKERPLLLRAVLEAVRHDDYYVDYCTNVVFSKEVTAVVSRAQASQMHGDRTEDPMASLVLPLSLPYYRFNVSEGFWKQFMNLLCMPPMPPPSRAESDKLARDPVAELGLTPNYILDAIGRSMMLHHLIMFADARAREIESGAVADRVKQFQQHGVPVEPHDYDYILDQREMSIAMTRMRQLLVVVKTYEDAGQTQLAGAAAATGGRHAAKLPKEDGNAKSSPPFVPAGDGGK